MIRSMVAVLTVDRGRAALNSAATGTRSERGGSWIGAAELIRSSYRRARTPHARGRCLGFRCVSLC
jgi:formylglycine-generating enzyme